MLDKEKRAAAPSWKEEDRPFSEKDKAKRIMLLDKILKKHKWEMSAYFIKRPTPDLPEGVLRELLDIIGEYLEGIPYQ